MRQMVEELNAKEQLLIGAGILLSIFCLFVITMDNDYNLFTNDQRGYHLFKGGEYKKASKEFSSLSWKGAALYRDGQFKEAAAVLSGTNDPDGIFNHGNSLLMLGKYSEAIDRYEQVLNLRPNWPPAKTNLAIAKKRAKSLEKKGGEMTGGKLGADEFVFSKNPGNKDAGDEVVEGEEPSEAEQRAIWLRQIQTRPADFLRSKFAYQYQMGEIGEIGEGQAETGKKQVQAPKPEPKAGAEQ